MNRMKLGLVLSATLIASSAAAAAESKTTCSRGADARIVEVIMPGQVGQSCDVRYTRAQGSNISVPYHADNSDAFCNEKARAITQRLASAGYSCVSAPPKLRADAAPTSDFVVEAQRVEAPVETPIANPIPVFVASSPAPSADEISAQADAPETYAAIEPSLASNEPIVDEVLEDRMSQILAQPVLENASGEPAQLVSRHVQTNNNQPQPSVVGRLVGAAPDAPRPVQAVTQAGFDVADAALAPPPAASPVPVADTVKTPAANAPLRGPRDIIRATLMAQMAAWNEGDLDAFMNTYWKDDALKFVSGSDISRGWSATMKHYRERYASDGDLGHLGFEKIEVTMVTDDVSVVTGRFNHAKDGQTSTGVFSLVMRRDNGVWRIVHDHTNIEAAAQ